MRMGEEEQRKRGGERGWEEGQGGGGRERGDRNSNGHNINTYISLM